MWRLSVNRATSDLALQPSWESQKLPTTSLTGSRPCMTGNYLRTQQQKQPHITGFLVSRFGNMLIDSYGPQCAIVIIINRSIVFFLLSSMTGHLHVYMDSTNMSVRLFLSTGGVTPHIASA